MSIRDTLNANQNIVVVVAVVIIAVAAGFMFMQGGNRRGSGGPGMSYYYDTVTKKVFTDDASLFPPIKSPDGNDAVRVHFFSFGDCSEGDRFIAYYEMYKPEAKQKLEAATASPEPGSEEEMMMMEMYESGVLQSVDGETWYSPASDRFQEQLSAKLHSDKGRARYCRAK